MSPKDFNLAWEERNRRLENGGVFEHLSQLNDTLGRKAVQRMTPTELIQAMEKLPKGDSGPRHGPART
jgi:hypothetical protein